jgi:hypothetical protein
MAPRRIPGTPETTVLYGPNEEESLWVWWGNQDLPSWTVLDSDGRFVDIRLGGNTTLEDIDSLLASVVGSQTDSSGCAGRSHVTQLTTAQIRWQSEPTDPLDMNA